MLALRGHKGPVRALAYSPDGRTLASGGEDNKVCLWNLATSELQSTIDGHKDWVRAVTFSADGTRLATGCWDGAVRVFRTGTLAKATVFDTLPGVWSVAFSPDGWGLAAGTDKDAYLWHLGSHPKRIILKGHRWPVSAVVFSPNGKTLATASHDRTIKLWDATWGRELVTLPGDGNWIRTLAFAPDGQTLASAGDGAIITLWDASGRELTRFFGHTKAVCHVSFSPEGRTLLSVGEDETARLWDLGSGQQRAAYNWGIGKVRSLAVAPDGMTVAVGGRNEIVVWDLDVLDW